MLDESVYCAADPPLRPDWPLMKTPMAKDVNEELRFLMMTFSIVMVMVMVMDKDMKEELRCLMMTLSSCPL